MAENLYSVVVEQHREDWIADYYYAHVQKCLEEAQIPTQDLTEAQAFHALNQVAKSARNHGWSLQWKKENGRRDGVFLNNGGVFVQVQEKK